jgi:hypothetical protein
MGRHLPLALDDWADFTKVALDNDHGIVYQYCRFVMDTSPIYIMQEVRIGFVSVLPVSGVLCFYGYKIRNGIKVQETRFKYPKYVRIGATDHGF